MILDLDPNLSDREVEALSERLKRMKFTPVRQAGNRIALVQGVGKQVRKEAFLHLLGVKKVSNLEQKYKLASRLFHPEPTVIECRGRKLGGGHFFAIAGPCSIESKEQIDASAKAAREGGAIALRGGAFKPRTSPYEFQGMGEEGLKLLRDAGAAEGLLTVSEVMEPAQVELAARYVDILQVGARNMQNFSLLKELGKVKNPILLKRGFSATYQDLLMAAEYILAHGNPNVILCERGIRTFETYTRNTLDLNAVCALRELTHLPIVVDPSHGTGLRSFVGPMSLAAIAAGTDGLIIEIHPQPDRSLSDAQQTISFEAFAKIIRDARLIRLALDSKSVEL